MVIEEAGAGLVVQCPKCGGDVSVPDAGVSKAGQGDTVPSSREDKERTVALKWIPPSVNPDGKAKK